jgi:hypothetical protein
MSIQNLLNEIKPVKVKVAVAAGTTDVVCDAVDMQGWESVMFVASIGALTAGAVTSLYATQCDTSGGSYADLEDTEVSILVAEATDNAILDLVKPEKRYIKAVVGRGTANAVINGVTAYLYNKKGNTPDYTNDTLVAASKIVVSPEEGTP